MERHLAQVFVYTRGVFVLILSSFLLGKWPLQWGLGNYQNWGDYFTKILGDLHCVHLMCLNHCYMYVMHINFKVEPCMVELNKYAYTLSQASFLECSSQRMGKGYIID